MIIKTFIVLLTTISISIIGCVGNCTTNNKLSGTLYVAGNEPFTYLALKSDDDKFYKLECDDTLKKELWSMQGKIVNLQYGDIKKTDVEYVVTISKILYGE